MGEEIKGPRNARTVFNNKFDYAINDMIIFAIVMKGALHYRHSSLD